MTPHAVSFELSCLESVSCKHRLPQTTAANSSSLFLNSKVFERPQTKFQESLSYLENVSFEQQFLQTTAANSRRLFCLHNSDKASSSEQVEN